MVLALLYRVITEFFEWKLLRKTELIIYVQYAFLNEVYGLVSEISMSKLHCVCVCVPDFMYLEVLRKLD